MIQSPLICSTSRTSTSSLRALVTFISITASRDIIQSIASEGRPETSIIALGFAGWSAGQIESEIKQNSWLTVPCDESLVFHTPSDDLWKVAARTIGVDVSLLVNQAGNA